MMRPRIREILSCCGLVHLTPTLSDELALQLAMLEGAVVSGIKLHEAQRARQVAAGQDQAAPTSLHVSFVLKLSTGPFTPHGEDEAHAPVDCSTRFDLIVHDSHYWASGSDVSQPLPTGWADCGHSVDRLLELLEDMVEWALQRFDQDAPAAFLKARAHYGMSGEFLGVDDMFREGRAVFDGENGNKLVGFEMRAP